MRHISASLSLSLFLCFFLPLSLLFVSIYKGLCKCVCVCVCLCDNGFLSFTEHSGHSVCDSTWSLLCQTEGVLVETYQANVCPLYLFTRSLSLTCRVVTSTTLPLSPLTSLFALMFCGLNFTLFLIFHSYLFLVHTYTHIHSLLLIIFSICGRKDEIISWKQIITCCVIFLFDYIYPSYFKCHSDAVADKLR